MVELFTFNNFLNKTAIPIHMYGGGLKSIRENHTRISLLCKCKLLQLTYLLSFIEKECIILSMILVLWTGHLHYFVEYATHVESA